MYTYTCMCTYQSNLVHRHHYTITAHVQVKLQLDVAELKEEIAILERQQPHPLSHCLNTGRRSSLEPVIFPDPTLSLLLQWCRAVGNIYGVQVCWLVLSTLWHKVHKIFVDWHPQTFCTNNFAGLLHCRRYMYMYRCIIHVHVHVHCTCFLVVLVQL